MYLDFKVKDKVQIKIFGQEKLVIGQLEELDHDQGTATYLKYLRPEETKQGKFYYHSVQELIKSDQTYECEILDIKQVCQVVSFKQYLQSLQQSKQDSLENIYFCRQNYEQETDTLLPDKLDSFICPITKKIVNPDESFVMCKCEKFFYMVEGLTQDSKCVECRQYLLDDQFKETGKRKRPEDMYNLEQKWGNEQGLQGEDLILNNQPSINENQKLFDENEIKAEEVKSKEKPLDMDKIFALLNDSIQEPVNPFNKQPSNELKLNKQNSTQAKPKKENFVGISEESRQKINEQVQRLCNFEQSKKITDNIQKNRFNVKQRIFQNLIYGYYYVIENQDSIYVGEFEQSLLKINETKLFEDAKSSAHSLESACFQIKNRKISTRLLDEYKELIKQIDENMKDPENLSLRKRIYQKLDLTQLVTGPYENLWSEQKKKKHFEEQQQLIRSHQISGDQVIIIKTSKEEKILGQNNENLNPQEIDWQQGKKTAEKQSQNEIDKEKQNQIQNKNNINLGEIKDFKLTNLIENVKLDIDFELVQGLLNMMFANERKRIEKRFEIDLPKQYQDILKKNLF